LVAFLTGVAAVAAPLFTGNPRAFAADPFKFKLVAGELSADRDVWDDKPPEPEPGEPLEDEAVVPAATVLPVEITRATGLAGFARMDADTDVAVGVGAAGCLDVMPVVSDEITVVSMDDGGFKPDCRRVSAPGVPEVLLGAAADTGVVTVLAAPTCTGVRGILGAVEAFGLTPPAEVVTVPRDDREVVGALLGPPLAVSTAVGVEAGGEPAVRAGGAIAPIPVGTAGTGPSPVVVAEYATLIAGGTARSSGVSCTSMRGGTSVDTARPWASDPMR